MGQQYCFSCGKALSDTDLTQTQSGSLALLCADCRGASDASGSDGRWMVRRGDERPDGPLGRDAVLERLAREQLGPNDQVSRVNGTWQRVVEHPDFRAIFIPGTAERDELERLMSSQQQDRARATAHNTRRRITLVALLVVGVGAPVWAWLTGATVLSDSTMSTITSLWRTSSGAIGDKVRSATDADAARESLEAAKPVPGGAAVERLRTVWPSVEEPVALLLIRGQISLAKGTRAGFVEAQESLEKAVAIAPEDPEAVSWLALSYLTMLNESPDQLQTGLVMGERVEALASGTVAAARATAAVRLASGDTKGAVEAAKSCLALGAPETAAAEAVSPAAATQEAAAPATQGTASGDMTCLGIAAVAAGDRAALDALAERFPRVMPLDTARGQLAVADQAWAEAIKIGRDLARRAPDDARPQVLIAHASAALGQWKEAEEAATRAVKAEPHRIDMAALAAEVALKVRGDGKGAFELYEGILKNDRWKDYTSQPRVLSDAATAAVEAGNPTRAIELADLALAADKGAPAAVLARARALSALGRAEEVDPTLATVDQGRLQGRVGARYLVGAARLMMKYDRNRPAATSLDAAIEADPSFAPAWLERARVHLRSDNGLAAVETLQKLALQDHGLEAARSPLVSVWYPSETVTELRAALNQAGAKDARVATQVQAALGVVDWASGGGTGALNQAVAEDPSSLTAHAALAQARLRSGDAGGALGHIARVLAGDPTLGLFHAMKGAALTSLGRTGEAEDAFGQAMVNAREAPSLYLWRAAARKQAGRTDDAAADLRTALAKEPDFIVARKALVDLTGKGR